MCEQEYTQEEEEVGVDFVNEGIFSVYVSEGEEGTVTFSATDGEEKYFHIEFSQNVKNIKESMLHIVAERITEDSKKQMILLLKQGKNHGWYTRYFQDDCILGGRYEDEEDLDTPRKHLNQDIEHILNVEDNLHWARALWKHLRDMEQILFPQEKE